MSYTVGDVARFAGVTVRTLHHYDAVGLLSPSERTAAGYRCYTDADLDRLQRILCYRQLEFSLDDIGRILADDTVDPVDHLRRQRELLVERIDHLQHMVQSVEKMMEARSMGISLTPEERFEVFGDFNPDDYAEEAQQRWGDTDAYQQSQRRTSTYTKQDWLKIKAEAAEIEQGLVAAHAAGAPADSDRAMDLVEAHRQHITRWFYDCSYEIQRGLGQMYVSDPRFTAHYDDQAPGLAQYVHDAIEANAERAGA